MAVDTKKLHKVILVIEEMRKTYPTMPSQMLATFLWVLIQEGVSLKDLAERVGTSQSSMSRLVAQLGTAGAHSQKGYGLVRTEPDPTETRRLCVFLTHKGRAVSQSIEMILDRN